MMLIDGDSTNPLDFAYLPAYAQYLKNDLLEEFVIFQINLSRQIRLPVLRFFESISESELIAFSKISSAEFLTHFEKNDVASLIANSLKQWVADELPIIGRYNIVAEDITQISYVRKQAFLEFLPAYTTDTSTLITIIKEVDRYVSHSDSAALRTFVKLFEQKINEHVHFVEKITETTPGIVYVYDIAEQKDIYLNGKALDALGYSAEVLKNTGTHLIDLEHPDFIDKIADARHTLQNGDIRSFEHRLKDNAGNYRWMRNYESVFKSDSDGKPLQVIGIAQDIENEKKMEQELLHREEQLLEAQELAEIGSFTWNLQNEESEVTPQLMQIFELENKKKLGDFLRMVHPSDLLAVQNALDVAINETGLYDCEFRFETTTKEKIIWSRGVVSYNNGIADFMKGTVMDVTDRHHMIQRLKRSEELYKQAQSLTHLGNWTFDLTGNNITWTDEMFRIFGLQPQSREITIDFLLPYLLAKDKELFLQNVKKLKEGLAEAEYFVRILLPDTSTKILNVKANVLTTEEGTVYKIIGTAQDVTQQKLNERKLRDSQNFIQKITDATPSIIAAYSVSTGKYLFINQAFEKILGYPPATVLEKGAAFLVDLIHPDDLQPIMEENNRALIKANTEGGHINEMIAEFKYRVRHSNGTYRWLHTFGTIFDRNEQKQVEHVLNVSIDITDRIEAENRLKEQEQLIQYIAEASPTILYLVDLKLASIVYINREVTPVLGYTPAEVIGMGAAVMGNLFYPDDMAKMRTSHTEVKHGKIRQYECRIRHKENEWKWLLVREIVFKQDELDKPLMLLCAALDITDRKKIEEKLFEKSLELEQSNSNLEEFAYVASHDLKEPLRKIATFGDRLLLNEEKHISADSLIYLQKIISSSRRMQQMIDDLLSVSMLSGEKNYQVVSLQKILNEVLQTLDFKIEESKATIVSDQLPSAVVIVSQFRQLFQNLLSNSLKFARRDIDPFIKIRHRLLEPHEIENLPLAKNLNYLELIFSDNGIGFDEKHAQKIFIIFHRLHNKAEYEGTGIGLAISKKIVENHGGLIMAAGNPGMGSTFKIIIPAE